MGLVIHVTSIPHNATRTFVEHMLVTTNYNHVHAEGEWQRVREADVVIAPIRKPEDVWRSWWRRGKFVRVPLNGELAEVPTDEFWGCYMLMDKYDREREILYVPFDHPEMNEYLAKVIDRIGQRVEPAWGEYVGRHDSETDGSLAPEVDLSCIYEYDFVKRILWP